MVYYCVQNKKCVIIKICSKENIKIILQPRLYSHQPVRGFNIILLPFRVSLFKKKYLYFALSTVKYPSSYG